jgi:hypothetical protein
LPIVSKYVILVLQSAVHWRLVMRNIIIVIFAVAGLVLLARRTGDYLQDLGDLGEELQK